MNEQITARQQQAIDRQKQILAVATNLFASKGYAATSTKQIAKKVGVTEGLIFHYFPKKLDLLKAIIEHRHNFVDEMLDALQLDTEIDTAEKLKHIAKTWLTLHQQEREFVTIMLNESHTTVDVQNIFQETFHQIIDRFADYLQHLVENGELSSRQSPQVMALTFFAPLFLFFFSSDETNQDSVDATEDKFLDDMVEQWLHGAVGK